MDHEQANNCDKYEKRPIICNVKCYYGNELLEFIYKFILSGYMF